MTNACDLGGGGQSPFSPKPLGTKKFYTLVGILVV